MIDLFEAVEVFTEVSKLVEAFGLERDMMSRDSSNGKTVDKSVFQ